MFNTSAELSTKASRVFPGAQRLLPNRRPAAHHPALDHFTPTCRIPTSKSLDLPKFDYLTQARLLPITFPEYYAFNIGSIDSENTFRFALEQASDQTQQEHRRSFRGRSIPMAAQPAWNRAPCTDIYSGPRLEAVQLADFLARNCATTSTTNNGTRRTTPSRCCRTASGTSASASATSATSDLGRTPAATSTSPPSSTGLTRWSARASIFYRSPLRRH